MNRPMEDERHCYVHMALCVAQLQLYNLRPDPRLLTQAQQAIDFLTRQDGLLIIGIVRQGGGMAQQPSGRWQRGESCATAYLTRMLDCLLADHGRCAAWAI